MQQSQLLQNFCVSTVGITFVWLGLHINNSWTRNREYRHRSASETEFGHEKVNPCQQRGCQAQEDSEQDDHSYSRRLLQSCFRTLTIRDSLFSQQF